MERKHGTIFRDLDFQTIFESNDSIRFVGVCTMQGKLLDAQYAVGVTPLLSHNALQFSAMNAAIRSTTRIGDDPNLGNPIYSVTTYENVKRATIPFGKDLLLLVSFEKNQDESKLMQKILEIIHKN